MGHAPSTGHGSMVRGAERHRPPKRPIDRWWGLVQYSPSTNLPSGGPVPARPAAGRMAGLSSPRAATSTRTLNALRLAPLYHQTGPREECGVVGTFAPGHPVARMPYLG